VRIGRWHWWPRSAGFRRPAAGPPRRGC